MTARITEVLASRRSVPLRRPFVTALRSTVTIDSLLVEVRTGDGCRGWGEATPVYAISGETPASVEACILGPLSSAMIGLDADDLAAALAVLRVSPANASARAGLDIALHDLTARRLGVSLGRLLGTTRARVATDVTVGAGSPAEMAAEAARGVAEGFSTLKLKLADHRHDDVERVLAVREAVGPRASLRLDANQGWTAKTAVGVVTELERREVGLELVEQPVPAQHLRQLAFVTARVATPVVADEAVWTPADVMAIVELHAADAVNLKLMKTGGLGPARAAVSVAEAGGVGWMVGSMMEGAIGVAAAASLAATGADGAVHDLDAPWWSTPEPLRYENGEVLLAPGPGWGFDAALP